MVAIRVVFRVARYAILRRDARRYAVLTTKTRNRLEVSRVPGDDLKAKMQSGRPNQEVRKRDGDAPLSLPPGNCACQSGNFVGKWIYRDGLAQV